MNIQDPDNHFLERPEVVLVTNP